MDEQPQVQTESTQTTTEETVVQASEVVAPTDQPVVTPSQIETSPITDNPDQPQVLSHAEQLGYVEVVNPDGSISQVKKDVALKMVANLEALKEKLGGQQ